MRIPTEGSSGEEGKRNMSVWPPKFPKCIVVALGGNAIQQAHQRGTAEEQLEHIRITCHHLVTVIKEEHKIIITHGNGPQIGNLLIQQEEADKRVPAQPMHLCGAMSQGQIGYMLQQVLQNLLRTEGINRDVLTVITQVLVDSEDVAFEDPTKPVGPFYDAETKKRYEKEKGYAVKKVDSQNDRPFRRVVPSPNPLRILEARAIKRLADVGIIIIASGGGGIPVKINPNGDYHGIDAVIDKDLAGEKLAEAVMADILLILTDVEKAYLNFGTSKQKALDLVHLEEAGQYLEAGHFASGSMSPKVEACIRFLEFGGERAIITALDKSSLALQGKTGTHFLP
jgi:carbamate kinase